jgi:hypothetical protein
LTLAAKAPNKATYKQIQVNLIDPLLVALSHPLEQDDPPLPKRSETSGTQDPPNLSVNSCLSPPDKR